MPEAVRNEIRTRHDVNYVVIAGAGTGKTTLLVDKLMALVRDGVAELSEIAAITFTEKAAAEISVRVESELEQALARGEDPGGRLSRAREQLDGAAITTLHGFAGRLIRERPIDAAVPPGHEILDDVRARLMFETVYSSWEREQLSQLRAPWRRLVEQGVDSALPGLAEVFADNLDVLQDYALPAPDPEERLADVLHERFVRITRVLAENIGSAIAKEDRAADIARTLLERLPEFTVERLRNPARALRALDALPLNRRKVGRKAGWGTPAALEAVQAAVTDTLDAIEAYRTGWRHLIACDAWTVLRDFLETYQHEKSRRAVLAFQDLLIAARNMLRYRKEARAHFQNRFKVLLVDEFQDTDPLQAEIVFFLAEDGARADTWQEAALVPGKLFIVGDPKQSIYRFRRADVEVFEAVRSRITAQGGLERTLERNFRSAPGVVRFVNAFFSHHIARPKDGGAYQPDYAPMVAYRSGDDGARVELIVHARDEAEGDGKGKKPGRGKAGVDHFSADEARALEARMLAARLEKMIGREPLVMDGARTRVVRPGDIALLFRATTHLDVYTDALQDRGLPVRVVGSTRFYAAQEVIDLANLLRAIASPHDSIAVVGTLRSPAFGFDDALITRLSRRNFLDYRSVPGVDALAEAGVDGEAALRVVRAYQTLSDLHRSRERVTMPALISRALNETALLPTAYASFAGEARILNLEKVRSLARTYEAAGMRSLERFANTLVSAIVGKRQEEEMSDTEVGDDVIRILTIHKSKGLEWPIVVVPGLMSSHRGADDFLVRRDTAECGFRAGEAQTHNWESLKDYEKPRVEAERMRLFYVATTRARDYLMLSGVTQNRQGKAAMLSRLSAFMADQAGHGWREQPEVVVRGARADHEPRGWQTAPVRIADTSALLDEPPMSSARKDLVASVDGIDDAETARRLPAILASRAEAEQQDRALRQAPARCHRLAVRPPDTLARRALLEAGPADTISLEARIASARTRIVPSDPVSDREEDVVEQVKRFLASPAARRVARGRLWGLDVPLLFLLDTGTQVETRVDMLFEAPEQHPEALILVQKAGAERTLKDRETWIEAVIAGLGSLKAPKPAWLEVYDLASGTSRRVRLSRERASAARTRLSQRGAPPVGWPDPAVR